MPATASTAPATLSSKGPHTPTGPAAASVNPVLSAARSWWRTHAAEAIAWRHHLHAHPELSLKEQHTTDFIAQILRRHGLTPQLFPGTGLMVDIGPSEAPLIAFRGDIDALPIQEATDLPYASTVPGVMHACGHDVHATVVLALACITATQAEKLPVRVRCIFQPAEEVMVGGAPDVISWGGLEHVRHIFAVHAEPKLPVGTIGVRTGAITSAADILTVTVRGPGGHTSRPHHTVDVVYALSLLASQAPALLSRRVDPRTGTVLTFGAINAGGAPNAIPESGRLAGTIRTADIEVWRGIETLLRELIADILRPTGATFEVDYLRGVPPVLNDEAATNLLKQAALALDPVAVVPAPQSSGGEDFSWYLEHVPGTMARLGCWDGSGAMQDLHRADLRVSDHAIEVGVKLFASVIDHYGSGATPWPDGALGNR